MITLQREHTKKNWLFELACCGFASQEEWKDYYTEYMCFSSDFADIEKALNCKIWIAWSSFKRNCVDTKSLFKKNLSRTRRESINMGFRFSNLMKLSRFCRDFTRERENLLCGVVIFSHSWGVVGERNIVMDQVGIGVFGRNPMYPYINVSYIDR